MLFRREEKYKLVITYEQKRLLIYALNELRNYAIERDIDTYDVDELLIKVTKAKRKKIRVKDDIDD